MSLPSRIESSVELTVANRLSSISYWFVIQSWFLIPSSDNIKISPSLPCIGKLRGFFSVKSDSLWLSNLLNKVIFTTIPVYEILFLRFRSPLLMRWDWINRKFISKLNSFSKFNHRFRLSFSWFIISNESNLNKSIIVLTPFISSSDTLLIPSTRYLSVGLDDIMISDMIDTILILMTWLDRW